MGKYQSEEKDGRLIILKSKEKLADENAEKCDELDLITKEELIEAIHKLANEVSQLKGEEINIQFTYENSKHKL